MDHYSLPYDLLPPNADRSDNVFLLDYQSNEVKLRTRISLDFHLFSFLLEGEKNVHYAGENVAIDNTRFLLLSSGNCLMSEKLADGTGSYRSVLLFFDKKILADFFIKHPLTANGRRTKTSEHPFLVFQKDDFLENYIRSLTYMMAIRQELSSEMLALKLEELLLYISNYYPEQIMALRNITSDIDNELEIQRAVSANIQSNISVEELAFLCNTSLSTFKRRFSKLYDTTPSKWILHERMKLAAGLLKQNELNATEIYAQLGYENLSSFIQSFKQIYGVTPKQYQIQN